MEDRSRIRYQSTDFEVSDATLLNEDRLHSLGWLFFEQKVIGSFRLALPVQPNWREFRKHGRDAMNYLTLAGVKWKKVKASSGSSEPFIPLVSETIFLSLQLVSFGSLRVQVLPSPDRLFTTPRFSELLSLNLGGQFTGNRWNTEANYGGNLEQRDFRFRAYRLFANLQWSLNEHHSVFAGTGYDFAGEMEIESNT